MAQKVNSFIKDINHFLREIKSLAQLLEVAILCTVDVVGLYLNIRIKKRWPHLKDLQMLWQRKNCSKERLLVQ